MQGHPERLNIVGMGFEPFLSLPWCWVECNVVEAFLSVVVEHVQLGVDDGHFRESDSGSTNLRLDVVAHIIDVLHVEHLDSACVITIEEELKVGLLGLLHKVAQLIDYLPLLLVRQESLAFALLDELFTVRVDDRVLVEVVGILLTLPELLRNRAVQQLPSVVFLIGDNVDDTRNLPGLSILEYPHNEVRVANIVLLVIDVLSLTFKEVLVVSVSEQLHRALAVHVHGVAAFVGLLGLIQADVIASSSVDVALAVLEGGGNLALLEVEDVTRNGHMYATVTLMDIARGTNAVILVGVNQYLCILNCVREILSFLSHNS